MTLLEDYIDQVREYYGEIRVLDFAPQTVAAELSPVMGNFTEGAPDYRSVADKHAAAAVAYDEAHRLQSQGNKEEADNWKMEADRRFEEAARMAAESNLTEISDYISTQKEQRKHYPDRFAHLPTKEFILQDSRATGAPSVTADIIAAIPDPMTGLRPPLQTSANPVAGASQAEQAIPNANGSYASQAQEEPLPEIEIIGPAEEDGLDRAANGRTSDRGGTQRVLRVRRSATGDSTRSRAR